MIYVVLEDLVENKMDKLSQLGRKASMIQAPRKSMKDLSNLS